MLHIYSLVKNFEELYERLKNIGRRPCLEITLFYIQVLKV